MASLPAQLMDREGDRPMRPAEAARMFALFAALLAPALALAIWAALLIVDALVALGIG